MKYDNVIDAKGKLHQTLAYYDKRAIYISEVAERLSEDQKSIETYVKFNYLTKKDVTSKHQLVDILDPKLSYMQYNIGYLNYGGYATWFMRMPYRQYKQGLRSDQCEWRDDSGMWQHQYNQHAAFTNNTQTGLMLEDDYPSLEEAIKQLEGGSVVKSAFHRDFAVYKDTLRKDYVIECKGIPTAFGSIEANFRCSDDLAFLRESIIELGLRVA